MTDRQVQWKNVQNFLAAGQFRLKRYLWKRGKRAERYLSQCRTLKIRKKTRIAELFSRFFVDNLLPLLDLFWADWVDSAFRLKDFVEVFLHWRFFEELLHRFRDFGGRLFLFVHEWSLGSCSSLASEEKNDSFELNFWGRRDLGDLLALVRIPKELVCVGNLSQALKEH